MSIFDPTRLPDDDSISRYGRYRTEEIKLLADFYRNNAEVQWKGGTQISPALLSGPDLVTEWPIFNRATAAEKKSMQAKHGSSKKNKMEKGEFHDGK
jgi:hypothetical protein